ncbi:AAA family ATPase [Streptomyces sp. SID3343]|uniref:AAA family ATPase n=1 Tax=Streptomyces sp. SID3343 TaxID=2690260 RepID=UPI001370C330|nr:AAA family ATPase [Streptomyces sp. SID3343]MYV99521.1 AAA family ATPase [Streptomyces sp. SID3343]
MLIVTGLPGAGKSTLLARTVTPRWDVAVLDADRVRARWERRAGRIPYRFYRPLVRLSHYREVVGALRGPGAVVVHDSGRNPLMRRATMLAARRRGSSVHALLLDVTAHQALSGQRERGRGVSTPVFARHHREWRDLLAALTPWFASGPPPVSPPAGFASCVLLDRTAAAGLTAIVFTEPLPHQVRRGSRSGAGAGR